MNYELECTVCSFETVVKGTVEEVFDAIESHQEHHEGDDEDHFVNLVRRG